MPIKVLVDSINKELFEQILFHYNSKKDANAEPLQRLDRAEGGFKINIASMKDKYCDANHKIKQLRWSKGWLVSSYHIGFDQKEEELLYESLVFALGECNVIKK